MIIIFNIHTIYKYKKMLSSLSFVINSLFKVPQLHIQSTCALPAKQRCFVIKAHFFSVKYFQNLTGMFCL